MKLSYSLSEWKIMCNVQIIQQSYSLTEEWKKNLMEIKNEQHYIHMVHIHTHLALWFIY